MTEAEDLRARLADAHSGLLRALDFRTVTPEGLAIKDDVRATLQRTGYTGPMGVVNEGIPCQFCRSPINPGEHKPDCPVVNPA